MFNVSFFIFLWGRNEVIFSNLSQISTFMDGPGPRPQLGMAQDGVNMGMILSDSTFFEMIHSGSISIRLQEIPYDSASLDVDSSEEGFIRYQNYNFRITILVAAPQFKR